MNPEHLFKKEQPEVLEFKFPEFFASKLKEMSKFL
jgi:hypothetical protein